MRRLLVFLTAAWILAGCSSRPKDEAEVVELASLLRLPNPNPEQRERRQFLIQKQADAQETEVRRARLNRLRRAKVLEGMAGNYPRFLVEAAKSYRDIIHDNPGTPEAEEAAERIKGIEERLQEIRREAANRK